jgi:RecB family exonuclease
MSQPLLDGMPARLYPAAPARLTTYADCPRRYRFGYLDRPTPSVPPPGVHASVGAAVHVALARWWGLPVGRRTPEAGGALLVAAWPRDGFRDDAERRSARERSREQVERYLARVDPEDEPVAVERTVWVHTARAALWGRVDRVDDRGDEVVVVDYKTGRSVLTVDDARESLALAVYAAGASRTLRRPCTRVELHHLPTGDVVAWDHTEGTLAQHLERADALAAELAVLDERFGAGLTRREADDVFPARVADRCGWCEFRSVCREGSRVPPRP